MFGEFLSIIVRSIKLDKTLYKDNKNLSILINKKSNLWRINDVVKSLDVHYLDIKNKNKVFEKIKEIKPDYVYHLATYGVHPSQNNLDEIIKTFNNLRKIWFN
mgnify:CR=1 FL=1